MSRRLTQVATLAVSLVATQLALVDAVVAGGPPEPRDTTFGWEALEAADGTADGRLLQRDPRLPPASEQTGRVLVRMRPGVGAPAQAVALSRAHAVTDPDAPSLRRWEVVVPAAGTVNDVVAALRASPAVAWAEPEYHVVLTAGPTDEPQFGSQWGLHNTGQLVNGFMGAPNVDMNLPEAWTFGLGSPSVTVAVIDDGIDFSHPDLAGTEWTNPGESGGGNESDGVDDDGNGYIDDVHGWDFCGGGSNAVFDLAAGIHGTEMASIIAAPADGEGMSGVAPGARLMALKFFNSGGDCGTAAAAAAIEYAVDKGVKIANASWITYGFSQALSDAVAAASTAGMLVVAGAGNDGSDNDAIPAYPASFAFDNVLSVGAVNNEGLMTSFSNYGQNSIDVSAPGEDVLCAVTLAGNVHDWQLGNGTSHATAMVSGVAALLGSIQPSLLNATAVKDRIIATGKPVSDTRGLTLAGRMPDARAALVAEPDIVRLSGSDRYATAAAISAATYFRYPFAVMVATGAGFPDALSGGTVAAQAGWPLLLVQQNAIPTATVNELIRLQPQNIVVVGGTGVISAQVEAQLVNYLLPGAGDVIRVAGANRYETSAAVSEIFEPGIPTAYIATGLNFPDALGAAPPSALSGGPLLLVQPNAIPAAIAAELNRLDPGRIVVLGGTGVVSDTVLAQLGAFTTGPVLRIAGVNRYETAAAISGEFFEAAETAFVATGLAFPDALAGGSSGGAFIGPLLLVPGTTVPASVQGELLRFQPARVFILGGTGVVSDSVVAQIGNLFP